MALTSDQMVSTALRLGQIKGAETPLTATELDDGRLSLNRMAAQLDAEGFELGFTTLATGGDTVTIPAYAEDYFINQLAARLAPEYGMEPLPFLVEAIKASRRVVLRKLNSKAIGQSGTYQDLIFGAIEMLNAKAGGEPITSTELTNAMPALNDLMLGYESKSLNLGYNVNTGTDLTGQHGLPDWSWGWIKAALAIKISSQYGVPVNDVVVSAAREGLNDAYMRLGDSVDIDYPATLPMGGPYGYFYGEPVRDALLTDNNEFLLDDESEILLGDSNNE